MLLKQHQSRIQLKLFAVTKVNQTHNFEKEMLTISVEISPGAEDSVETGVEIPVGTEKEVSIKLGTKAKTSPDLSPERIIFPEEHTNVRSLTLTPIRLFLKAK